MSTIFEWDGKDIAQKINDCEINPSTPFMYKYMPKDGLILEAGCGLGQFVKFLSDKGYSIKGIEINEDAVRAANKAFPNLDIISGDVAKLPYPDAMFDGVLSLGVVEHFIEGPKEALKEMFRVMKPGGTALICVPDFNKLRQFKHLFGLDKADFYLRQIYYKLKGIKVNKIRQSKEVRINYLYNRWPAAGDFYEYRFKHNQFDSLLEKAGFKIIVRAPIDQLGGMYHEFGGLLVPQKSLITPGPIVKFFDWLFSKIPYFHNHMYLCIIKKP
ncbi:MAG: class I SAM-dependent methyltransferase [Candidatus Doudnabacteria bacterium]|nr:class I SAM-dependent methyltransferase [Candidatus Doudnabacteria bacterium]